MINLDDSFLHSSRRCEHEVTSHTVDVTIETEWGGTPAA